MRLYREDFALHKYSNFSHACADPTRVFPSLCFVYIVCRATFVMKNRQYPFCYPVVVWMCHSEVSRIKLCFSS